MFSVVLAYVDVLLVKRVRISCLNLFPQASTSPSSLCYGLTLKFPKSTNDCHPLWTPNLINPVVFCGPRTTLGTVKKFHTLTQSRKISVLQEFQTASGKPMATQGLRYFYEVNVKVSWLSQLIGCLLVFLTWIRVDESGKQESPMIA